MARSCGDFAGGTVSIGAVIHADSSGTVQQHTAGGAIGTTKTLAGIAVATPDGGTPRHQASVLTWQCPAP